MESGCAWVIYGTVCKRDPCRNCSFPWGIGSLYGIALSPGWCSLWFMRELIKLEGILEGLTFGLRCHRHIGAMSIGICSAIITVKFSIKYYLNELRRSQSLPCVWMMWIAQAVTSPWWMEYMLCSLPRKRGQSKDHMNEPLILNNTASDSSMAKSQGDAGDSNPRLCSAMLHFWLYFYSQRLLCFILLTRDLGFDSPLRWYLRTDLILS
jgi:hypothetical protein